MNSAQFFVTCSIMRAEEQLQLAYMQIASLKNENGKLLDRIDSLYILMEETREQERKLREAEINRLTEAHKAEVERLMESNREMSRTLAELTAKVSELTLQLKINDKMHRGKRFGQSTESLKFRKGKDDDDREDGRDKFDGTPGSDTGGSGETSSQPEQDQEEKKKTSADCNPAIKALQDRIKRTHPGCSIRTERVGYGKTAQYTENPIRISLEDYHSLPSGASYVMRNGEIDKSVIRILVTEPEKVYEYLIETATVRTADGEDYRTADSCEVSLGIPADKIPRTFTLSEERPIKGCLFGLSTIIYILEEKFVHNTPFEQIVKKLRRRGLDMNKSTLIDNVHRAISYMRGSMESCWKKEVMSTKYVMFDESPGLVGCAGVDGRRRYRKRYFWAIVASLKRLVWFNYEDGGRGKAAIKDFLGNFSGYFTTDGYCVYKIYDDGDSPAPPDGSAKTRKRVSCLVHIRRPIVDALQEDFEGAYWFIERIMLIFSLEHQFKLQGLSGEDRRIARLRNGSVADLMGQIEARLKEYESSGYAGCGELMRKAMRYANTEWPSMKVALEDGDILLENNTTERCFKGLKLNLRNATNIGSEESAKDNAFMFSVIESCKACKIQFDEYLGFLLRKLKGASKGYDLTPLLPCNYAPSV